MLMTLLLRYEGPCAVPHGLVMASGSVPPSPTLVEEKSTSVGAALPERARLDRYVSRERVRARARMRSTLVSQCSAPPLLGPDFSVGLCLVSWAARGDAEPALGTQTCIKALFRLTAPYVHRMNTREQTCQKKFSAHSTCSLLGCTAFSQPRLPQHGEAAATDSARYSCVRVAATGSSDTDSPAAAVAKTQAQEAASRLLSWAREPSWQSID